MFAGEQLWHIDARGVHDSEPSCRAAIVVPSIRAEALEDLVVQRDELVKELPVLPASWRDMGDTWFPGRLRFPSPLRRAVAKDSGTPPQAGGLIAGCRVPGAWWAAR